MKKLKSLLASTPACLVLFLNLIFVLSPISTNAAPQTTRLNPVSATVGTAKGTITSSNAQPVISVYGGQVQNPNNILAEDGSVATFDPSTTIGGVDDNSDSYLYIDYQKNTLCTNTIIQSITVHAKWSQNTTTPQNDAAALLVKLSNTNQMQFSYNVDTASYTVNDQVFGGIISPLYGGSQSPAFSGNPPSTLTEQTGSVNNLPTLAQLNDPSTRIYFTLGENPGGVIGQADSVWLEVTHDDSACASIPANPSPIISNTPNSPKTGAISIAVVLISTTIALVAIAVMSHIILKDSKGEH